METESQSIAERHIDNEQTITPEYQILTNCQLLPTNDYGTTYLTARTMRSGLTEATDAQRYTTRKRLCQFSTSRKSGVINFATRHATSS